MRVIGTAGHVDHGKSTLIEALTGMNPDRLKEEREREMTIDLGFAWLRLPDGESASIIDVPGHEDFIRTMLAGVGGIDLALLVIAADESVMPQTREHLDVLHLLAVQRGIVVLTKTDLVEEPDWLELVQAEISETVSGTVFERRLSCRYRREKGKALLAWFGRLQRSWPSPLHAPTSVSRGSPWTASFRWPASARS
jgi:selenocysteine-specific elongation factor